MVDLSLVIPVFEEETAMPNLLSAIQEALAPLDRTYEVIVVDDGSADSTLSVLEGLLSQYPRTLRIGHHLKNRGNGAALRTGIRMARGDIVVTMDADGQHDPVDILELIGNIPPFDIVIAARTDTYGGSWYRNLANTFYNRFASWLTRAEIKDLTSGYRAFRRKAVLHFLPLFPEGFSAPTTTTMAFLKAGYNVKFISINVGQRTSGKSKINLWRDGTRFFMIILRMIMLYDPMRIFLPLGVILLLLGFTAWVLGILYADRLVFPNSAIFMLLTALIVWLLGLISAQISSTRIHYFGDETVEEFHGRSSDRDD